MSADADLLAAFAAVERERGITARIAAERCRVLRRFASTLGERRLIEATEEDIEAWLAGLPVDDDTRSTHRTALRKIFDFARRTGLRRDNPLRGVLREPAPESMALIHRCIEHQRFRHLSPSPPTAPWWCCGRWPRVWTGACTTPRETTSRHGSRPAGRPPRPATPTSATSRRSTPGLCAMSWWSATRRYASTGPASGARCPGPLSNDDLRFALQAAEPRMHAWLALLAFQGLRCKEVVDLTVDDILLTAEPPALIVEKGKGRRGRTLPLSPEVVEALNRYGMPRAGHIFCRPRSSEPMAASTVSKYVSEYLHGIGISASAHQGRHWFGTNVYKLTKDLRLTQELMGHSSPSTTAIYVQCRTEGGASAVQRLGRTLRPT